MINIGIMGATGAVGRQMLECLEEEKIEVGELKLFSSIRSVGKKLMFNSKEYVVEELKHNCFDGLDIVLGAVSADLAREYADDIVKAGAIFIDNSSAFRLNKDVPLVVPEINGEDAKNNKGIIANPNCSTIITLMAVKAINKISNIECMIASTYQAVSGAGKQGIEELEGQLKDLSYKPSVFPYQIAYNCIPCIGKDSGDGYTSEEDKLQNEGQKIMHLPDLKVTCTCVRVPVTRSHSISVSLKCKKPLSVEEVRQAIENDEGVKLVDDLGSGKYPMPLDTSNQNIVYVGRIRKDKVFDGGISLFCAGDQIRKGAATNAVQIIKCLY